MEVMVLPQCVCAHDVCVCVGKFTQNIIDRLVVHVPLTAPEAEPDLRLAL